MSDRSTPEHHHTRPSPLMKGDDRDTRPADSHGSRDVPPALTGAALDRVREAWEETRRVCDPELPELTDALTELAAHARRQGFEAADVLKALDTIIRPERGGDPRLDWDHVRELAGRHVIRAFYRDD